MLTFRLVVSPLCFPMSKVYVFNLLPQIMAQREAARLKDLNDAKKEEDLANEAQENAAKLRLLRT